MSSWFCEQRLATCVIRIWYRLLLQLRLTALSSHRCLSMISWYLCFSAWAPAVCPVHRAVVDQWTVVRPRFHQVGVSCEDVLYVCVKTSCACEAAVKTTEEAPGREHWLGQALWKQHGCWWQSSWQCCWSMNCIVSYSSKSVVSMTWFYSHVTLTSALKHQTWQWFSTLRRQAWHLCSARTHT